MLQKLGEACTRLALAVFLGILDDYRIKSSDTCLSGVPYAVIISFYGIRAHDCDSEKYGSWEKDEYEEMLYDFAEKIPLGGPSDE